MHRANGAAERAEQVREHVRRLQLAWDGQPLGMLTVSAGVAGFPVDGDAPDTLLRAADQALYRAKELGRDRVIVAPQPNGAGRYNGCGVERDNKSLTRRLRGRPRAGRSRDAPPRRCATVERVAAPR
jgi:hypothetical protein